MHDPKNGVAVRDNSTSYLNHFPKSFCGYDAVVFLEKCCQISKEEVWVGGGVEGWCVGSRDERRPQLGNGRFCFLEI